MKWPWNKSEPDVAPVTTESSLKALALARRIAADAALNAIYAEPHITAARQESEEAWRALSAIQERERYDQAAPGIIGQRIVEIRPSLGGRGVPTVSEYQGVFNFTYVSLVLENGVVLVVEYNGFKYTPLESGKATAAVDPVAPLTTTGCPRAKEET